MIYKKNVQWVLCLWDIEKELGDNNQVWPDDWQRIAGIISQINGVKVSKWHQGDKKFPDALEVVYSRKFTTKKNVMELPEKIVIALKAVLKKSSSSNITKSEK